jgi:ankyrin repeat protein
MSAARTGSIDAVKLLLARGANVNAAESVRGQTALMWAVAGRHHDIVQTLLEHKADIHLRSKRGSTAFLFAAQQGDLPSAQMLLAAGANVNDKMPDDASALLIATASGLQRVRTASRGTGITLLDNGVLMTTNHKEVVAFLLEKGADPNAADVNGFTPLHSAARDRNQELVKMLLAGGADPNPQLWKTPPGMINMAGATPFALAAFAADSNLMRFLAANGADPNIPLYNKSTPLMLAAGLNTDRDEDEALDPAIALEAAKTAIELGNDVGAVNDAGRTAMHGAGDQGREAIIQLLADKGAPIDPKDTNGDTPFSFTLRANHKSAGDLLVKLGADPSTPLHCDTRKGCQF